MRFIKAFLGALLAKTLTTANTQGMTSADVEAVANTLSKIKRKRTPGNPRPAGNKAVRVIRKEGKYGGNLRAYFDRKRFERKAEIRGRNAQIALADLALL